MTTANRMICIATFLFFFTSQVSAAEKLSDLLREANWDGIIGTWVDAESKGAAVKTTYAWKIKDRVIEVTNKQGDKEDVGLIGVNGKTNKVFYMSASSDGTSTLGEYDIDDNGDAILGVVYTSGDGQQGGLRIRHSLESKDVMTITIELPEPIKFKMIREKPKK